MTIDEENIGFQHIQDVLKADLLRRLREQYNEGTNESLQTDEDHNTQRTLLVSGIENCNTISDVSSLLLNYKDLFSSEEQGFILANTENYLFRML